MEIKDEIINLRKSTGMNRREFCDYFNIPYRTVTEWELGNRKMPDYVLQLIRYKIKMEQLMKKTKGKVTGNFSKELAEEVEIAKTRKDWGTEYMTLMLRDEEKRQEGIEIGIEQGMELGAELGKLEILFEYVNNGIVSTKKAAEDACITEVEFLSKKAAYDSINNGR